jgi:hypothetical protein
VVALLVILYICVLAEPLLVLMIFFQGVPLSAKLCFYLLPCRSDALPFDEIKDVYLLDFVGPPGFVNDIAPKVERSAHFILIFSIS